MVIKTSGAAPCLSCGTRGGFAPTPDTRPFRAHGLCSACTLRAKRRGTYAAYPACGERPVPYVKPNSHPGHVAPWHPAPWASDPVQTLCKWDTYAPAERPTSERQREDCGTMLWVMGHDWGYGRWRRAVRPSVDPAAAIEEAEQYAAAWLARKARRAA